MKEMLVDSKLTNKIVRENKDKEEEVIDNRISNIVLLGQLFKILNLETAEVDSKDQTSNI